MREISAINGLDSRILGIARSIPHLTYIVISSDRTHSARFLRYLATLHVYQELSPDVFANNRISAVMDTGKSVKDLFDS